MSVDSRTALPADTYPLTQIRLTYGALTDFHLSGVKSKLLSEGKALNSYHNHRTAINKWLKHAPWKEERNPASGQPNAATPNDVVGEEFGTDFVKCLAEHLTMLEAEGMAPTTVSSRKHLLNEWQKSWFALLKSSALPERFSEALSSLFKQSKLSLGTLARECGVNSARLKLWAAGDNIPAQWNLQNVVKLEKYFDLQPGTLLSRLPYGVDGAKKPGYQTNGTPYRAYLSDIQKKPYKLPYKFFTSEQQREWQDLVKFYTDSAWVAAQGFNRHKSGWRTRKNNNRNATAEIKLRLLENFYGFLLLPEEPDDPALKGTEFDPHNESHQRVKGLDPSLKGLGFSLEQLSLALFTDPALIHEWIQFLKVRAFGNKYNNRTINALSFCRQLVRPEYGFLWQLDEFGKRVIPPLLSRDEWGTRCGESHRRIGNMVNYIKNEAEANGGIEDSRDTAIAVVIPLVLEREHPITALTDIAIALRSDFNRTVAQSKKAEMFRNMLMVRLVASNPMRALNIAEMRYRKDCKGYKDDPTNLYKTAEGHYRLKYEIHELKNGAFRGRYDREVNQDLTQDLDEFFTIWRPLLRDADKCDFVFRPSFQGKATGEEKHLSAVNNKVPPMSEIALSTIMRDLSQWYLNSCPGFGLHAARAFAVTEWLKHNPGSYAVPADMLHDSEEVVRASYSWVTPDDTSVFWNRHLSEIWRQPARETR